MECAFCTRRPNLHYKIHDLVVGKVEWNFATHPRQKDLEEHHGKKWEQLQSTEKIGDSVNDQNEEEKRTGQEVQGSTLGGV